MMWNCCFSQHYYISFKADVIVNSIANDNSDLAKCGTVAAAFAKVGGSAMCKEFASFGGLKCGQVQATMSSSGSLPNLVLHASIRAWDGDRTYKVSALYL